MSATKKKNRIGSTFVGVLIAIVLLSLAAVPLLSTLINQTKATKMNKMRVFGTQLAYNYLERYRIESFYQLATTLDSAEAGKLLGKEDPILNPTEANVSYLNMRSRFNVEILVEPKSSRSGILKVYVRWTENGHNRKIEFSTVIIDSNFDGGMPEQYLLGSVN